MASNCGLGYGAGEAMRRKQSANRHHELFWSGESFGFREGAACMKLDGMLNQVPYPGVFSGDFAWNFAKVCELIKTVYFLLFATTVVTAILCGKSWLADKGIRTEWSHGLRRQAILRRVLLSARYMKLAYTFTSPGHS